MILDMQGNPVTDSAPSIKKIEIFIDPLLEDERLEDFVNNYLVPFMNQLQVPVLKVTIHE
jgi:type I site-specific restriction-modification system R (restriction) subunit